MREMGDPVLATVAGFSHGAVESGSAVTFGGATQLLAVVALLRHAGVGTALSVETTTFVADDGTADLEGMAADLDVSLSVTDPGFDGSDHPAMAAYARGEAKEGVGMGGALALADRAGVPMVAVRERVRRVYDRVTDGRGEE
jgi:NaMN:DMB phosphoribosyltransferase